MIIGSGSDTHAGVQPSQRSTTGNGGAGAGGAGAGAAGPSGVGAGGAGAGAAGPSGPSGVGAAGASGVGAAGAPSFQETLRLDLDRAMLEDQRDFLLTSLRDLEAEHDAGDIGDLDYEHLRDDYTARAAGVLRALEAQRSGRRAGRAMSGATVRPGSNRPSDGPRDAAERGRRRWWTAIVAAGIAVVAVLAAWAVTASSGSRLANQPITGTFAGGSAPGGTAAGGTAAATAPALDPRLSQAAQLVQKGKITDALKLYDQVLKARPNDPEALASEGWLIAQAGMAANRIDLVDQGLAKIEAAEHADASFPTAHFFRASLLLQAKGDAPGAVTELRQYLGLVSPSAPEVPQVEQMLQAAIKAAGANVPPGPNAPPGTNAPPSPAP
jgi:tetratricopeptide (TPR) repeat protein